MRSLTASVGIAVFAIGMLFVLACDKDPREEMRKALLEKPVFATELAEEMYIDSLTGMRHFKNDFLKNGQDSPLRPEDRELFGKLDYYPVDTDMISRTRLHLFDDPEHIMIATTHGDEREALRYGYIDFDIDGESARLFAYKFTAHAGTNLEPYIFIPFKDATSGVETYVGGRYLDILEEYPGVVLIDFNDAYNPYCVYNDRYICPIPPEENHLRVAIRAGEKDFSL